MQTVATNLKPTILAMAIALGLFVQCDTAGANAPGCKDMPADCITQTANPRGTE